MCVCGGGGGGGGVHSPDSVNSMVGGSRDLNTVPACEYSYLPYIVYTPGLT